jgi:GT2 family glycosyltransferase
LARVRLSAIIPTHDRPETLRRCLETLQAQEVSASELEVVVVDDGSSADIGVVVEAASSSGPIPMRCERQPLTGLNGARNRGAALATGELLAFLDDDTLVAPGWARALLRAFSSQSCAGVGGRVVLDLAGPAPEWLAERRYYLAEYDLGGEARWLTGDPRVGGDPVPVGSNCAVRRSDFDRVGGFHLGLDRIAGSLVSNGDTEFFRRLRAAGGALWYEPDARVAHCVPAERLTVAYFTRRHFAQGVSDELLLTLEGEAPTWRRRYRHSREIGHAAKILGHDLVHGQGTVNARFWASYWAGRLTAVGRRPPDVSAGA